MQLVSGIRMVSCPNCNTSFRVERGTADTYMTCNVCGQEFAIADAEDNSARTNNPPPILNETELIGKKLGNCRLQTVLGRGRMGVVYLAQDEALLRSTAVKILSWMIDGKHGHDPVKWFLAEARTIAAISHPGIVQIYGAGRYKQHYYIAMEYVDGRSVDLMLAENGPFSQTRATEILIQTAEALHAAHMSGVIHRDVKPANLLLTSEGKVKLSDFGMALTSTSGTLQPGQRVGTPYYTAPEIWRGQMATPATDIYSLGATYFHLLTGKYLFQTKSVKDLERRHLEEDPPDPRIIDSSIPEGCWDILKRCLAKSPNNRFSSAQELVWAASVLLKEMESPREDATPPPILLRSTGFSPVSDNINRTFVRANELFANLLGFESQPFGKLDPAKCPFQGEPFSLIGEDIFDHLQEPGAVVMISGPLGSGRGTLAIQQLVKISESRPVVYVDISKPSGSRRPLRRVCLAAGSPPAPTPDAEMQGLLRHIADTRKAYGCSPVIAINGLTSVAEEAPDLELLIRGAVTTKSYSILAVGLDSFIHKILQVPNPNPALVYHLKMRPLNYLQVYDYINNWIQSTIKPEAPSIIITPDAGMLVGYWSGGIPGGINRIASNMLLLAALKGRRVVNSWDAWAGAMHINELRGPDDINPELKFQPAEWPTGEILQIIDECRNKMNMNPRKSISTEEYLKENKENK